MSRAVLCVDDQAEILTAYRRFLSPEYAVTTAERGADALAVMAAAGPFAVVVADLNMPGMDGIRFLAAVRERHPDTVRVLATGAAQLTDAVDAVNHGHVFQFLTKPFTRDALSTAVRAAAVQYEQTRAERARAESALRASEERYRHLFEANPHPMWVQAADDQRFLAVNDAALAQYGYGRDQFLRLTVRAIDVDGDPPAGRAVRRHRTAAGEERDAEVVTHPIEFDNRPARLVLAHDVTQRVRTEAALRLRDRAIQAVEAGIVITDPSQPDNPIVYASPGFERITGHAAADVLGRNCRFLQGPDTDPAAGPRIREAIRRGEPWAGELLNYKKNGTPFWNALSLSPVRDESGRVTHFVGVQADVTARRALEAQLRQAQKLESIGQLSAGVAHEINTPVQYITDNTAFLGGAFRDLERLLSAYRAAGADPGGVAEAERVGREIDLDYLLDEAPRAIQQTLEGLRHVTRIVKAMKEFAHPGTEDRVPLDVNHALETVITVARNEWKYCAAVTTAFAPDLPPVPALVGEMNQVFLNLLVNAAHAVHAAGRADKGSIVISTRRTDGAVQVEFADTGCGIPEAIRDRVFDPFFTTKPVGQGTGQGLALAHAVVQRHGGAIWFESECGRGTTFFVRLPVGDDRVSRSQRIRATLMRRQLPAEAPR